MALTFIRTTFKFNAYEFIVPKKFRRQTRVYNPKACTIRNTFFILKFKSLLLHNNLNLIQLKTKNLRIQLDFQDLPIHQVQLNHRNMNLKFLILFLNLLIFMFCDIYTSNSLTTQEY